MSLAELLRWPIARKWGEERRQRFNEFLKSYEFAFCDGGLCQLWAETIENAQNNGRPIDNADAWIAATALYYGAPLLTHNPRHFEGVDGLEVVTMDLA